MLVSLTLSFLLIGTAEADPICRFPTVFNGTGTHTVCAPGDGVTAQRKLVVFFCGSNSLPPEPSQAFTAHALSLGFHFLGVKYEDFPSVGKFCKPIGVTEPDCYEKIRLVRLFGGSYGDAHVDPSIGAIPQVQRGLQNLASHLATEGWADFVDESGAPAWDRIIVAGESQGSGHALMLSQHFKVARVLQFAGVDDVVQSSAPYAAPWISRAGWLTPVERIYGLGNSNGFCCQAWHLNWPAAGLLGSMTNVDGAVTSFGGARQLCSSIDVESAHVAPVTNAAYAPVWTYMLTGEADWDPATAGALGGCDCPADIYNI